MNPGWPASPLRPVCVWSSAADKRRSGDAINAIFTNRAGSASLLLLFLPVAAVHSFRRVGIILLMCRWPVFGGFPGSGAVWFALRLFKSVLGIIAAGRL